MSISCCHQQHPYVCYYYFATIFMALLLGLVLHSNILSPRTHKVQTAGLCQSKLSVFYHFAWRIV